VDSEFNLYSQKIKKIFCSTMCTRWY